MQDQIEQVEIHIDTAKKAIAMGDALERLTENADYKLLIENGYFTEEPCRLVKLKAAPSQQDDASQKAITKDIDGIGSFYAYLYGIEHRARIAQKALEEDIQTLNELEAEQAQGGAV